MKTQLLGWTPDDAHLNRLWRERFGQPMPVIGASDITRRILRQSGVSAHDLNRPASDEATTSRAPKGVDTHR